MKVEKNIQVVSHRSKGHRPIGFGNKKYPFEEMDTGDSFFVPEESAGKYGQKFRGAVSHRNNRNNHDGKRFIVRAVDGGYRCWRIE